MQAAGGYRQIQPSAKYGNTAVSAAQRCEGAEFGCAGAGSERRVEAVDIQAQTSRWIAVHRKSDANGAEHAWQLRRARLSRAARVL